MTLMGTVTQDTMPGAAAAAQPIVWVGGVPEPGLRVVEVRAEAPLDVRSAELRVLDEGLWRGRSALLQRHISIALAHALSDGSSRWEALAEGTLQVSHRSLRSGGDERLLTLVDDWSARLDRPIGAGWAVTDEELSFDPRSRLVIGERANRSRERYTINGRSVYVLEQGGDLWTVGDALDTLSAFAEVDLSTDLLPEKQRAARLPIELDLSATLGDVLRRLLRETGTRVRAAYRRVGGSFRRSLAVVPGDSGRRFALPWGGAGSGASRVARVDVEREHLPPRRWVMRGARPTVEATLDLVPGWDAALGGLADSEYGRSTSSDFTKVRAVYRHWVLNEDGAYSGSPFNQGPAFDLAGLFADPAVVASPTPVGDCLVRDSSGRRLGPVVEVSTDSGSTWSRYSGAAVVMRDRAGVVLDDAVLPAGVLSAAKSGALWVRLTGTLRSPRRLERSRWRGNPFAGAGPTRVIEQGETYRWQRVDSTSIHADALDLGELDADEVDDRRALEDALLDRLTRTSGGQYTSGQVDLIGAWPTLQVGDRLLDLGGRGINASGVPTSVVEDRSQVAAIRVRFGGRGGPTTRVTLIRSDGV